MRDSVTTVRGNVRKGVGMAIWLCLRNVLFPGASRSLEMRAATRGSGEGCRLCRGNADTDVLPGIEKKQNWRCGMNRTLS